jgi:hypothetical protein
MTLSEPKDGVVVLVVLSSRLFVYFMEEEATVRLNSSSLTVRYHQFALVHAFTYCILASLSFSCLAWVSISEVGQSASQLPERCTSWW